MSSDFTPFVPGTEIIDAQGQTYTVEVDRRPKGKLWARGRLYRDWRTDKDKYARHELHTYQAPFLPVEGNEELVEFQARKRAALRPSQAQVDYYRKRMARVRAFAELTVRALAVGQADYELIVKAAYGDDQCTPERWKAFKNLVGNPVSSGEHTWRKEYKASLPHGIGMLVLIEGNEGLGTYVLVPPEFSQERFPPTDTDG
jgi:hypothetical protein